MASDELLTRIAAAVYEAQRPGQSWADAQPDTKSDYLEDAKVAYDAMADEVRRAAGEELADMLRETCGPTIGWSVAQRVREHISAEWGDG